MKFFKNKKQKLTSGNFGGDYCAEFFAVRRVLTHVRFEHQEACRSFENARTRSEREQLFGKISMCKELENWIGEYCNELLNM